MFPPVGRGNILVGGALIGVILIVVGILLIIFIPGAGLMPGITAVIYGIVLVGGAAYFKSLIDTYGLPVLIGAGFAILFMISRLKGAMQPPPRQRYY